MNPRKIFALLALALVAIFAIGGGTSVANAATSGSSSGTHTTRLGPGQTWTAPDGEGKVTNSPDSADNVVVEEIWNHGDYVKAKITIKKGVLARGEGLNGDEIDADGGKIKLDDCDGNDIDIKNGGGVNEKNCDNNDHDFEGGGLLTGPDGGNNGNDVDLNGRSDANVENYQGSNNKIHN